MTSSGSATFTWFAASLDDVPTADHRWMDAALRTRLETMRYPKRRLETTLARWTAKATIAATYGIPIDARSLSRVVVRNAIDGAPEADLDGRPLDAVIAMTDRADVAACMVIAGSHRVGCDLELVEPRSDGFVRDYFTPAEQRMVASNPEPDFVANLIWSAKESALKVLRTGLRRDTRTVAVTFDPSGSDRWARLVVTEVGNRRFPGWWLRSGELILTCATEVETDPPVSLIEPHGLRHAMPRHSWMGQGLT